MTFSQVKKELIHLGFEQELDTDLEENLIEAVNRAVKAINELRPKRAELAIVHSCEVPDFNDAALHVLGRHSFEWSDGKAIWFEAVGQGKLTVKTRTGVLTEKTWENRSGFIEISTTFDGDGDALTFVFEGSPRASVRNICVYNTAYTEGHVPGYAVKRTYDLAVLTDGAYLHLTKAPIVDTGAFVIDLSEVYEIHGDRLVIPCMQSGVISLEYRTRVPAITGDDPEEEIPLEEDLAALVPPLSAFWLWLDDDQEKAAVYKQLYTEMAARIDRRSHIPARIKTNNW